MRVPLCGSEIFVNCGTDDTRKLNPVYNNTATYVFIKGRRDHISQIFHQIFGIYFDNLLKSPQSIKQGVDLFDEKPRFGPQDKHENKIQKIYLRRFPFSRFLTKTLRVNKVAMKKFLTNLSFEVDFKLQVVPLIYKINTHNMNGVVYQAVSLSEGL